MNQSLSAGNTTTEIVVNTTDDVTGFQFELKNVMVTSFSFGVAQMGTMHRQLGGPDTKQQLPHA